MTKTEAIKSHRTLWNHIANLTTRQKRWIPKQDALISLGLTHAQTDKVQNFDPACQFAEEEKARRKSDKSPCIFCPLDWGKDDAYCTSLGSPITKYNNARPSDWQIHAFLAKEIANIPEYNGTRKERDRVFGGHYTEQEARANF